MAKYHYLLTYSVKPAYQIASDIEKADKVRSKIADISDNEWEKSKEVETTFSGSFDVYGAMTETAKKNESIKFVKDKFVPILKLYSASKSDVKIPCVMMVSEINESFSFTVEND